MIIFWNVRPSFMRYFANRVETAGMNAVNNLRRALGSSLGYYHATLYLRIRKTDWILFVMLAVAAILNL